MCNINLLNRNLWILATGSLTWKKFNLLLLTFVSLCCFPAMASDAVRVISQTSISSEGCSVDSCKNIQFETVAPPSADKAIAFSEFDKATSTTRLVSKTGVNIGNCSVTPCKTIQFAVDNANSGDMIVVSPGTYHENVLVTKPGLTLQGSGASSTIIDGGAKSNVVYAFHVNSFTIEGFTIKNAAKEGSLPGAAALHLNPDDINSGNFVVKRNILQDSGYGIVLWNTWFGGSALFENNLVIDNEYEGIDFDNGGYEGLVQMVIKNNTIANNTGWGYIEAGGGDKISNIIVNNVIVSNGFRYLGCQSNLMISPENILYVSSNDVFSSFGNNYSDHDCIPFVPSPAPGEISVDPKFQDAANKDYRLASDSPAIDAGTNTDAPTIDLDGNNRPNDGNGDGIAKVDMGAYEFGEVEKEWCCSYEPAGGGKLCGVAEVVTFEKCRNAAKEAGAKKFRFGDGSCEDAQCKGVDVQEYLKVALNSFTATAIGKSIYLDWETANESDSMVFRIWRGLPKDITKGCTKEPSDYKDITLLRDPSNPSNPLLIWTLGSSTSGSCYSRIDNNVETGITYCYALEDVDSNNYGTYYLDFIASATLGIENGKRACIQLEN